ncbi:hypothetical protein F2P81_005033 [Scophthalmus maximus]|uniref:Uncharacterized protein n=1 Tax=Scophthalmus maximus TaxID=52904 RepID=A0A6A4T820_SCOMX|nr:hypothetical protein F2P81_005033 [Scophthalmus maximus]
MALAQVSAFPVPYNWTRDVIVNTIKKECLVKELEELKTQLQRTEKQSSSQEQRVYELHTILESETCENKKLWDQVEYLTCELQRQRELRFQLDRQLEETQKQLACQTRQQELVNRQRKTTQKELDGLTVSYEKLHRAYDTIYDAYRRIQHRNGTHLRAERHRNITLQKQSAGQRNRVPHRSRGVYELSSILESETSGNRNQFMDLTGELHRQRQWTEQQTQQLKIETVKNHEESTLKVQLGRQLGETQKQLARQKRQQEGPVNRQRKKTQKELKKLTVSYNMLHQAYCDISYAYRSIQQRYDTDLRAERHRNVTLQQQIAYTMSWYNEYVQNQQRPGDQTLATRGL